MIKATDLSGTWQFEADEECRYADPPAVFSGEAVLPGTTAQNRKGRGNTARETGCLTELYPYSGNAWFRKTVDVPEDCRNKHAEFFMERTRITKVWVNGSFAGSCDSLCTPHRIDVTPWTGGSRMTVTVCVNNKNYPTAGGHMTSRDTQTNWNGITGEISLRFYDDRSIRDIRAFADAEAKEVRLRFTTHGQVDALEVSGEYFQLDGVPGKIGPRRVPVEPVSPGEGSVRVRLEEEPFLWDEYSPVLYRLFLRPEGSRDIGEVCFGFTGFRAEGLHFYSHGREVFLRGKHEGLLFPRTGAAPTDLEEWIRVLKIAKSYGINHYRFHTCCPPDAAFTAADLLGIYFEPEIPFWGTLSAPGEEGYREEEQLYLIAEGRRMLKEFGNHPSFCMFSLGNELWGNAERIGQIMADYKASEKRILFTQGSNDFQFSPVILPEDDFFAGVRFSRDRLIRGSYASCDQPFGHIQTDRPSTGHSYDDQILPDRPHLSSGTPAGTEIEIQYGTGTKRVSVREETGGLIPHVPVVSHEIGQYYIYPDYRGISKYQGVLRAENLSIFQERLADAGMAEFAQDFFECSGRLAVQCYKEELEAALRSGNLAGFQMLDLQDFMGQGTALVGILDAFMDSKGLISPEEWRGFCSDSVILARFSDYIVTDRLCVRVSLRHHAPDPVTAPVRYELCRDDGMSLSGELPTDIHGQGLFDLGSFQADPGPVTEAHRLRLVLRLPHTQNTYDLWQFPFREMPPLESTDELRVTSDPEEMLEGLRKGKRVLFLPRKIRNGIPGTYCTDFWCFSMFRDISRSMGKPVPVGTLGLRIQNGHRALRAFPCEKWSTPQWYEIVTHSESMILDGTDLVPIVQVIDNVERNHRLALLFECSVGTGRLLVCTANPDASRDRPEVREFFSGILEYAKSDDFVPEQSISFDELQRIIETPAG